MFPLLFHAFLVFSLRHFKVVIEQMSSNPLSIHIRRFGRFDEGSHVAARSLVCHFGVWRIFYSKMSAKLRPSLMLNSEHRLECETSFQCTHESHVQLYCACVDSISKELYKACLVRLNIRMSGLCNQRSHCKSSVLITLVVLN